MMAASRETYVPRASGSYRYNNKVGSPSQLPPSDIRSTCPDVGVGSLSYSSKEPYSSQREDRGQFGMLGPQLVDQQRPRTNRFLATAHPRSISSHPDHYMYPSFQLLSPDFAASQPPSQPPSQPSCGSARQQQGLAPRDVSTRQQPDRITRHSGLHVPLRLSSHHPQRKSPTQPGPNRASSRSSFKKRSEPPGSRRRIPATFSSRLSPAPSESVAHDTRHMASFPMPLPPHPAANYLPFLEPMPSSASKALPETPETVLENTASENLQNGYSARISFDNPQVTEAAQNPADLQTRKAPTSFGPCTPHEAMLKASTTVLDWPCSTVGRGYLPAKPTQSRPAVVGVNRQWVPTRNTVEGQLANMLPFGRGAPAIMFLSKAPFVDCVRQILDASSMCGSSNENGQTVDNEDRHEPVWQQAYLRIGGLRYAQALPIKPQQFVSMSATAAYTSFTHTAWSHVPDAYLLSNYVQSFSTHIQTLCPVIPNERLNGVVVGFLQHLNTLDQQNPKGYCDPAQIRAEYAIELLVFALGSVCWAKCGGTIVEPGPEFYARAKGILELFVGEPHVEATAGNPKDAGHKEYYDTARYSAYTPETTLDLARCHLLAALYCGQLAWVSEAAGHVHDAGAAILYLLHRPGRDTNSATAQRFQRPPLVEYFRHPHRLSGEERQLVLLYWTCVLLEFEINAEVCLPPSPLLRCQAMIPPPVFDPSPEATTVGHGGDTMMADARPETWSVNSTAVGRDVKQERDVQTNFAAQVCLRGHLNRIYGELYCGQNDGRSAVSAVEELQLQFHGLSPSQSQPSSVWKSTLTARARAGYWEGLAWSFLPVLLQADGQTDPAELASGVGSLAEVIRAYHGVAGGRLILPNAFGAAMAQCRYLLLLFAASRAIPSVAAVADNAMLGELVQGTMASLQDMAGPPGVLQAARRMLHWMQQQLQPSALAALPSMSPAGNGPAEVPAETVSGLFLFCPPFSLSTDSGSALATATTLSSFTCWSSGTSPITRAFPSPFGTPLSSLSSPLASASPFPNGTSYVPEAKPGFELSFPWQLPGGLQQASGPSSSFADMLEFSCQLGLSGLFDSPGEM